MLLNAAKYHAELYECRITTRITNTKILFLNACISKKYEDFIYLFT